MGPPRTAKSIFQGAKSINQGKFNVKHTCVIIGGEKRKRDVSDSDDE